MNFSNYFLKKRIIFLVILMEKKPVNICIYSRQFVQNIESILMNIEIVIKKMKEGFDEYHKKFKGFLKCLKNGNLEYYMKKSKARKKGIEINDIKLDEIERLISDPNKDSVTNELLKDIEKTLFLVKDINYENMKQFLLKSNLIHIFTEFENYLFNCMRFVLLKHPEILDDKAIKLKEIKLIKDVKNISLFNEIVAENTINNLFYENYYKIFKYFKKPLGLELNFGQSIINKLNGYKEIRNLLTHGDGTITLLFQKRIFNWNLNKEDICLNSLKLGDKIIINEILISDLLNVLFDVMIEIDILTTQKFPELRFEIESLDHLFFMTYIKYLIEKWTDFLNKY